LQVKGKIGEPLILQGQYVVIADPSFWAGKKADGKALRARSDSRLEVDGGSGV